MIRHHSEEPLVAHSVRRTAAASAGIHPAPQNG
jgi:hypothetical protein